MMLRSVSDREAKDSRVAEARTAKTRSAKNLRRAVGTGDNSPPVHWRESAKDYEPVPWARLTNVAKRFHAFFPGRGGHVSLI
jgi:hypothetical protein